METLRNTHKYDKLDHGRHEIRVLELLPGQYSDNIRGRLLLQSLDGLCSYDALSYVWGDPKIIYEIEIDGNEHLRVTKNAKLALRDLRSDKVVKTLWIDAICINQQDSSERNHQVTLMQRIYKQATVVRSWLNIPFDPHWPAYRKLAFLDEESTPDDLGEDPAFWQPISVIGDDEYWTRVWIQQEVAHASNLTINCLRHQIKRSAMMSFQRIVRQKHMASMAILESRWESVESHYMQLSFGKAPTSGVSSASVASSTTYRYNNLLEALSQCRHLKATDPRDRVYAILSLVEDLNNDDFMVNYDLSVSEVYTNVAKMVMMKYRSLGFLTQAFTCSRHFDLPSWVPDWSTTSIGQPLLEPQEMISTSPWARGSQFFPQLSNDSKELIVHGIRIAKLEVIYSCMVWDINIEGLSYVRDWERILTMQDVIQGSAPQEFGQLPDLGSVSTDVWKALLRTMMRAETAEQRSDAEEYYETFKLMLSIAIRVDRINNARLPEVMETSMFQFWTLLTELMAVASLGNYLCITHGRSLGLVPDGSAKGDEIWALVDCPKPILLRPVSGHYQVVGPCYVDDRNLYTWLQSGPRDGTDSLKIQKVKLR